MKKNGFFSFVFFTFDAVGVFPKVIAKILKPFFLNKNSKVKILAFIYFHLTVLGMSNRPWHVWPGRHWPLSLKEEFVFVSDLLTFAKINPESFGFPFTSLHASATDEETLEVFQKLGQVAVFERGDVTILMDALRCGLNAKELLSFAPGVAPSKLLAAYCTLESLRYAGFSSWQSLVSDPTLKNFQQQSAVLKNLLPTPTHRLSLQLSEKVFQAVVASTDDKIKLVGSKVQAVESFLEQFTESSPTSKVAVALGYKLFNPHNPALWGDPYFLPTRVGTLMPIHINNLLQDFAE